MHIHPKNGFTLVETLVAVTILLLIVVGPMSIAQKGIQNAYYANEQMTAVFLAQEAIEAVRQLRDNVALSAYQNGDSIQTNSWIPTGCGTNGCAYISGQQPPFVNCIDSGGNGCQLYITSTGKYTNVASGNSPSKFTRKVYINDVGGGAVSVAVEVSWIGRIFNNTTRTVRLESYVYDHYERYEN